MKKYIVAGLVIAFAVSAMITLFNIKPVPKASISISTEI